MIKQKKKILDQVILLAFCIILESSLIMTTLNQQKMLEEQIIARNITDQNVLKAMSVVDRSLFVPLELQNYAWNDTPLNIGYKQTISQPYIVAFMTEAAQLNKNSKVLEVGTGSGYQAAILAEICKEVYTIEIVRPLGELATKQLQKLGYQNLRVAIDDGYKGWPSVAPFDVIIVTAAPEEIPIELINQLKQGGKMIIPIGKGLQKLMRITKTKEGLQEETLMPVRFVPMVKADSYKIN
jgi:protein-L-isoaspartate(D-aspartate) O-methyltransferase